MIICLVCVATLPGQTERAGLSNPIYLPVDSLPQWIVPVPSPVKTGPDTLGPAAPVVKPRAGRPLRWLGMGLLVVSGALSYHYQRQSDLAYQNYLSTGDASEIDRLYDRTGRYDRLAGWSYAGAELGLLMISWSIALDLAKDADEP